MTDLYIGKDNDYVKVDLFEDENIFYENKLIELGEVGAIFSDSTNTFTIPATEKNNKLFDYWFEINYDLGISFNPQKRVKSYIEINTIPYRFGQIQLEGVNEKDGIVQSYSITFYSEILSLEDVFGDDTLSDLITDDRFDFSYSLANAIKFLGSEYSDVLNVDGNKIDGELTYPLIYPLEGDISFLTSEVSDINDSNNINFNNLRPGIRVQKIIELIEEKYNIKFEGKVFNSPAFTNLFLWLNAEEDNNKITKPFNMLQLDIDKDLEYRFLNETPIITQNLQVVNINAKTFNLDLDEGTISIKYNIFDILQQVESQHTANLTSLDIFTTIRLRMQDSRGTNNYEGRGEIQLYNKATGEVILSEYEKRGSSGTRGAIQTYVPINISINTSNISSIPVIEETYGVRYLVDGQEEEITGFFFSVGTTYRSPTINNGLGLRYEFVTLSGVGSLFLPFSQFTFVEVPFDVKNNLPDITVNDYVKYVIKLYGLIIRPISSNRFYFDTFENYIEEGETINITKYADTSSINSERKEVNKSIEFKYNEIDSIFSEVQNNGNGKYTFDVDSKNNKEIELETSIATPTRLLSGELQDVQTNINLFLLQDADGSKTWSSDPIHYYYNGVVITNENKDLINFQYIEETFSLDEIPLIDSSNSQILNQVTNDLNFSPVIGSNFHNSRQLVSKNQFNNFYKPFIDNIYASNNRVINLTLYLPYLILNKIDLNSILIYRNNQFLIENIKVNLNTGKSSINIYPYNKNRFEELSEGFVNFTGVVQNSEMIYNKAKHFTGFTFNSNSPFFIIKRNTGDGTEWIDLPVMNYNRGRQEVVFNIKNNSSNQTREMELEIGNDDGIFKLLIIQF